MTIACVNSSLLIPNWTTNELTCYNLKLNTSITRRQNRCQQVWGVT